VQGVYPRPEVGAVYMAVAVAAVKQRALTGLQVALEHRAP
jgi:hypothetical protein